MGNIAAWLPANEALITIAGAAFTFAILVGGYAFIRWYLPKPLKPFEPEVVSDWRPTGQIDFIAADAVMASEIEDEPAPFNLLVQEQRLVANIAGAPHPEIRWRYATKAEVKDVVRRVSLSRRSENPAGNPAEQYGIGLGGNG
jgi:hypothetical protein